MSVTLRAVGSHGLEIGHYLNDSLDELLNDLKKEWPEYPPQTEVPEDLDDRYWHYDINWWEDLRMIKISVNLPLEWQIIIYPKTVEFWAGYSYSALNSWFFPDPKPYGDGKLRTELFRLMRFLKCEEVIYLPDNARPMSQYLDLDIFENISYQELKERIIKKFDDPMIYPGGVDFERLDKEYKTAWVVDTFKDLHSTIPEQPVRAYHRAYYEMNQEEWAQYLIDNPHLKSE